MGKKLNGSIKPDKYSKDVAFTPNPNYNGMENRNNSNIINSFKVRRNFPTKLAFVKTEANVNP